MKKEWVMTFELRHQRAAMGNDILVRVTATSGENILQVTTALDGFTVGSDTLEPSSVQYERTFLRAGSASPGTDHTLTVTATDQNGKVSAATQRWTDL